MCYKLLVRCSGRWQQVGFSHTTPEGARREAYSNWPGMPFMVLPDRT